MNKKQPISMVRGDSELYDVEIVINGDKYTPTDGDLVRFAVKRPAMTHDKSRYLDDKPLLVKEIPISTMQLTLEPEDTKNLPFGAYEYDMEIKFEDGRVKTFVEASPFVLRKEVH